MNNSENLRFCRQCTNSPLHESRLHGWKDRIFKTLGRTPMRCHRCSKRYFLSSRQLKSYPEVAVEASPATAE